jgi:hypothetical protein
MSRTFDFYRDEEEMNQEAEERQRLLEEEHRDYINQLKMSEEEKESDFNQQFDDEQWYHDQTHAEDNEIISDEDTAF